ncbi:hypothetical protein ACJX0J_010338, partial [Zea mays]
HDKLATSILTFVNGKLLHGDRRTKICQGTSDTLNTIFESFVGDGVGYAIYLDIAIIT